MAVDFPGFTTTPSEYFMDYRFPYNIGNNYFDFMHFGVPGYPTYTGYISPALSLYSKYSIGLGAVPPGIPSYLQYPGFGLISPGLFRYQTYPMGLGPIFPSIPGYPIYPGYPGSMFPVLSPRDRYTVTVNFSPGGSTNQDGVHNIKDGDKLTIKAIPEAGYFFTGWMGDASGSDNPLKVKVTSNLNITAKFVLKPVMVKDICPINEGSSLSEMTNINGTLSFVTSDEVHGTELWKSDGTKSGTVMVKDIVQEYDSSDPKNLTNVDGMLFFVAYDENHGYELENRRYRRRDRHAQRYKPWRQR